MNGLLLDVRHAWRQILRYPRFSSVVIVMLALGAAVQTSSLAIVDAVYSRYVPAAPLRNVFVLGFLGGGTKPVPVIGSTSFRALEAGPPPSLAATAGVGFHEPATLIGAGRAETVLVEPVTGGFARTLDLHPEAGRWLTADDDRAAAAAAVVISDRLWHEWFHAGARAPGTAIVRLAGQPSLIVGVAEPEFRGVNVGLDAPEVWISDAVWSAPAFHPIWPAAYRDNHMLMPFVRLQADHTVAELVQQLQRADPRAASRPGHPEDVILIPARTGLAAPFWWFRTIVFALAGLVFFAVCANVANLFYARNAARTPEFAVRGALGAGIGRLVRLMAVEASIVGAMSGLAGMAIAAVVTAGVSRAFPLVEIGGNRIAGLTLRPDPSQLLYAVLTAVAAALAIGTLVSLRAVRRPVQQSLHGRGGDAFASRSLLRTALVALQITAALVLVIGAGLFLENPPKDLDLDRRVKFDTSRLTAAALDLSLHGYGESQERSFFRRLQAAIERMPQVNAAALATGIPGGGAQAAPQETPLIAEDSPTRPTGNPRRIRASIAAVSPGFLDALGLRVAAGRDFQTWDDQTSQPVAMVSNSAAEAIYPRAGVLGRRVQLGFGGAWATIVGVFPDPVDGDSDFGVFARPSNVILVPLAQRYSPKLFVLARTVSKTDISEPLFAAVAQTDDRVALFRPQTLEAGFMAWVGPVRAANRLMMALGGLALLVALLGIYSVIDFLVSNRTREFGIRLALGSTPRELIQLVLQQATRIVLIGLLVGVFVATVASRVIEMSLVRLMPNQIATWAIVPVLILLTGLVAAYVPARRAGAVDPSVALRCD